MYSSGSTSMPIFNSRPSLSDRWKSICLSLFSWNVQAQKTLRRIYLFISEYLICRKKCSDRMRTQSMKMQNAYRFYSLRPTCPRNGQIIRNSNHFGLFLPLVLSSMNACQNQHCRMRFYSSIFDVNRSQRSSSGCILCVELTKNTTFYIVKKSNLQAW